MNEHNLNFLYEAIEQNNTDLVDSIITEHEGLVYMKFKYGGYARKPLHWASRRKGSVEIIKLLIEHGAKVNETDGTGETPLHFASSRGFVDVVKLLLEHGANVNAKDYNGQTPLDLATLHRWTKTIRLLIENGANVNETDRYGGTSLYYALQYNFNSDHNNEHGSDIDTVKLLIKNGADVNVKDKCGETPLYLASRKGSVEIVKLLLENGADVNAKDYEDGWTPLHYVENYKIAKLLIDNGADVNAKDNKGLTPIDIAKRCKNNKIVRLLAGNIFTQTGNDELVEDYINIFNDSI